MVGRLFTAADLGGTERALLISERLWATRFGRDASIVDRVVTINDQRNRIVGVLPARFSFPDSDRDGWRPIDIDRNEQTRVFVVVRRQAEVSRAMIDDRLKGITQSLRDTGALPRGQFLVTEEPLQFSGLGRSTDSLYFLLAAAGALLLIACVNVTNLLLVRASARRAELALKHAMGASRVQLMRDASIESIVLAAIACAAGLWIAKGLLDGLLALAPPAIRMASRYTGSLDPRAVVFEVALTVTTCVVLSVLPAWRASRVDAIDALRSARSTIGRGDLWWQSILMSTQIALVVVLLAGAGLLLRSFVRLNQLDLGFNPERVVEVGLQFPRTRYATPGASLNFMRQLEMRVEQELGVAATVGSTPVRVGGFSETRPEAEGITPPGIPITLPMARVSADYFDLYQIPILEGRALTAADGSTSVILNEVMARKYFGNVSPIGRRFRVDTNQPWLTVVGIARDVRLLGPADSADNGMEIYVGYPAVPGSYNFLSLGAEAGRDATATAARIKQMVWELDPQLPIASAGPVRAQVREAISRPRFVTTLGSAFTLAALLIAAVGVYAVSAYWVSRRRYELAIRMAVGATPQRLLWAVLSRSLRIAAIGGGAGLLVAVAGAGVLRSLLFETDARDPLTFIGVTVALAAIATAACLGPALKAARVDPMTTLRSE